MVKFVIAMAAFSFYNLLNNCIEKERRIKWHIQTVQTADFQEEITMWDSLPYKSEVHILTTTESLKKVMALQ